MTEFEIGTDRFRAGKLAPLDQLKIAKRLLAAVGKIGTSALASIIPAVMAQRGDDGSFSLSADQVVTILPAMLDAIGSMSDADTEVIVTTALSCVQRLHKETGGWQPLAARANGQLVLAFQDIDLPVTMQLVYKVIEGNLGSFFP